MVDTQEPGRTGDGLLSSSATDVAARRGLARGGAATGSKVAAPLAVQLALRR